MATILLYSQQTNNEVMHYEDSLDDEPISVEGITFYYHGNFKPVTQSWQKERCKFLQMTYTKGVLYENEAIDKSLEIRQLIPSREKRISPDCKCLFRSLSYVITWTDHYHQQIRELLIIGVGNGPAGPSGRPARRLRGRPNDQMRALMASSCIGP